MELFKRFNRNTSLVLLSSCLFIIFSQGCTTVHEMPISQHNTSAPVLTNARADIIAANMTTVLQTNDGPGDVDCDVRFERDGNVTTFTATTGNINSQADFNTVIGLPGRIKVVNQINWCGALAPNIIGCAPVPGNSLAVVRFTLNQEGILWVHEFGHNMGLNHRNNPNAVMNPVITTTARRVTSAECGAYR